MEAQLVLTSKKLTHNESKRADALLLNFEALPVTATGRASLRPNASIKSRGKQTCSEPLTATHRASHGHSIASVVGYLHED